MIISCLRLSDDKLILYFQSHPPCIAFKIPSLIYPFSTLTIITNRRCFVHPLNLRWFLNVNLLGTCGNPFEVFVGSLCGVEFGEMPHQCILCSALSLPYAYHSFSPLRCASRTEGLLLALLMAWQLVRANTYICVFIALSWFIDFRARSGASL